MRDDLTACPYCGSERLFTVRTYHGPHYARTGCSDCGKHIRWEAAPMTRARAAAFVMPFGKFRGSSLAAIGETPDGRRYLAWLAGEDPKPTVKRAIEVYLGRRAPDIDDEAIGGQAS